ncbi:DUF1660 family phage protein [Altererythrobacter sp. H2]|uniref:DUF1660 family phage protein n=1 Tax=Altererythrobacter sp. H2 TaxID=3108391 RepID=UPI002B4BA5DD|nr:DUF1660 family phage protein [Altererythrobacter sp. H2]WRK96883.1 DUF1660 family phage protein [Altererythrobacter sp. H2]
MTDKLMCRVFGHRVNRKRVRRFGETFVGRCRRCNAKMEKADQTWQLLDDAT